MRLRRRWNGSRDSRRQVGIVSEKVRWSWLHCFDFGGFFKHRWSHGFHVEVYTPFGRINNCKCTAPLLLDHGDVPKSDAAKSRSCEIRLSLLRVSSTFLRRIPRNNQQNFWERPENQVRDKNQTNRTIPEPRKDNNNDARWNNSKH